MQIRRPAIVNRKLRFALVGCGRIARNHFDAMRQHAEHIELVGVCDTHPLLGSHGTNATKTSGYNSGLPSDLSATTSRRCAAYVPLATRDPVVPAPSRSSALSRNERPPS